MNATNEAGTKEECPKAAEGFFFILIDGVKVLREPTEDKWYVGMTEAEPFDRDGEFGQYIGEGGFVGEEVDGEWPFVDMGGYDYLVEQL
jgi:hypothetical protein